MAWWIDSLIRSISSSPATLNWWTDFFSMLFFVQEKDIHLDENGNIGVEIFWCNDDMLQSFTIRAKRKKLRRLKDVAAYNVAQYLSCHSDVEDLQLPISLRKLVKPFVITISGDYIFDLNENWNKRIGKYCINLHPFDPLVRLAIFLTTHYRSSL